MARGQDNTGRTAPSTLFCTHRDQWINRQCVLFKSGQMKFRKIQLTEFRGLALLLSSFFNLKTRNYVTTADKFNTSLFSPPSSSSPSLDIWHCLSRSNHQCHLQYTPSHSGPILVRLSTFLHIHFHSIFIFCKQPHETFCPVCIRPSFFSYRFVRTLYVLDSKMLS